MGFRDSETIIEPVDGGGAFDSNEGSITSTSESSANALAAANSAEAALASKIAAELAETNAETAETNAETAETNAETAETNASTSATNAATSETNAATSETNAAASASAAASSAADAQSSEDDAEVSETNAANSAAAALVSENNASSSESNAATSAVTAATQAGISTTKAGEASVSAAAALVSENNAGTSETNAADSETNAATSATDAAASETNAATSATNAATSETNAADSETNAATSAANAAASETNAANSATASASSATASASSSTAASASETAAASSATSASGSASSALNFQTQAGIYSSNAASSASSALSSKNSASSFATNSANSATSASNSASTATTKASEAATSATNASTSETNAATSATNAATSETNASTSETNASNSATSANNSATAAQTAQAATELVFDNFDDKFLGTKSSDPSVDNDGNALVEGAMYYNSSSNAIKFYNGSSWEAPSVAASNSATAAATSATNASNSAGAALTSASNAANSATSAATSETNAASSASAASTSETNAATSATNSANSATAAQTAETNAETAQAAAETAETNAETAQAAAETAETNAETSETNAAASASTASTQAGIATTKAGEASTSATNAATSATNAATSETNAATSETNAATSETNAATSATASEASKVASVNAQAASETAETNAETAQAAAETAQTAAETAETNAATSETNAASSASSASTDAGTATTKAGEAATSATNAAASASTATTKASEASTSASNAATSETNAATSATNAATSETNSSNSATASASSASAASTSETNAATSETNAGNSATASASSASAASTSETNAATSASGAATSATNASTSATAAQTAQTAAEAALDSFDDRYLGEKSSDPTVDNDGDALVTGALYFSTGGGSLRVYDGTQWNPTAATTESIQDVVGSLITGTTGVSATYNDSGDSLTIAGTAATTSAAGTMSAADKTKLDGVEASATADQTAAEIRTLVESATDSNVFTDADHTKLGGIEAGATGDQTNAEIRAAVEAATDSNVFTDADHTKLNGIAASATNTAAPAISTNGSTPSLAAGITAAEVRSLIGAGTSSSDNATHTGEVTGSSSLTVADNVIDAGNLKVTGNGTSSQFLRSDGDGTFTWATPTDTNYSSGDFNHDSLSGYVANEHIDWTASSAGTIHLTNLPATALTSVQTAVSQVAMLALTTQEGDVVVRSDENQTYMHNGGTAGTMADFTLLATPTDSVTSVDGATGVVTLNHDNLTGYVANEHIDWTTDQGATNIHSGNYVNTVYTHPTHPGDDVSVDTGALTGATVISDLDFNVTTDTLGHVTDANATVATRTLSLADLGYTGATNANYITNNNQLTNGAGYTTNIGDITGVTAGSGITGGGTSGTVTINHADTSSQASVDNSGGTVIQDITLDTYGHLTGITSYNLDGRYYTETEADSRFVNVTGDTMTGNLTVSIPDSGGAPAMTAELDLWGFEGRGAGISIRDNANSASGATDREWFIGTGYNQSGFNIGYSSTATQTSYSAQNKFSLSTSGNAVFAGTAHVNNNQKVFADNYHPNADAWTTARTLSLSGDASGSVTWDGSANASISVTVADDSHNHTIANVDGLQTALNGKLSTSGKAADSNLLDGIDSGSFLRSDAADTATGLLTLSGQVRTPRIYGSDSNGLRLGDYDSTNTDQWPVVEFLRGETGWDEGFIKGASNRGVFGRSHIGYHMSDQRSFAFHSSSWDTEMEINGDGRLYQKGPVGINYTPTSTSDHNLTVSGTARVTTDLYVGDQIIHDGDTDTYMQFHAADQWRVVTAGAERLEVNNTDTTLATNLQINSHAINMDMNNVADNAIEIREVRDSTWPLQFVSNDVGNDNHSGFWVGSNGYPDMRLRRDDGTVRALISSWETSFVSNGLNVTGNLQAFDDIIIGNYSSTDTGSLVLTGSTANKQAVLKCTNGNLHMDSDSGSTMYLNYYSGNGIAFGGGGTGVVAWMGSDGDLWKGSNDNTGSRYWHAGNDGSSSGLDADLLDGNHASAFATSAQGTLATNALPKSGGTLTGDIVSNARSKGVFGTYDSTLTDHIWSMGTAYRNHASGTNFGNLYGLAYKHTNNSTGGTMASGHQMVWCQNGTPNSAMGTNIWTSGSIIVDGTVDGRDVAADGTKLDGIESGATADQTASEILTAIKTVDGSGSGLDADLLDGLQLTSQNRNNQANRVVRTQGSGYAEFGWINTTSGNTTSTLTDIYVNTNDGYIRKATPAHFRSQITDGVYYPASNPNGYTTYTANQALNTNSNATFNALYVAGEIIHSGDTNTYISFHAEDHWRVVTGGAERLEVNNVQITSTEPIHAPSFHGSGSSLTGVVLNSGDTMTGPLVIDTDNNSGGGLRLTVNQTSPNQDFYFAQEIVTNLTGSTATTGDREQGGIYLDLNSTATGGDISNEHRVYGAYLDVYSTGDADLVCGVYAPTYAAPSTGTTGQVMGGYFLASDYGGAGNVTWVRGIDVRAQADNSGSSPAIVEGGNFEVRVYSDADSVGQMYGVKSKLKFDSGGGTKQSTSNPSYVFNARYENSTGVSQGNNSYLYYGSDYGVRSPNAYGVYIAGDLDNYFGGKVTADSFVGDGSNLTNIPGPSTTAGDVGTYAYLWRDNAGTVLGSTHSGSTLFYAVTNDDSSSPASANAYKGTGIIRSSINPSGTWRAMGSAGTYSTAYGQATLYVRIS